ncbi:hypothetical protein YB2330_000680 [Saitoella coloradoensis]
MSRHREVRNLDLDEEMYDDDDYYDGDGHDMTYEEQEQMEAGVGAVQDALDGVPGITLKEIRETLYYYYFDLEKSIAWLLEQHSVKKPAANPKAARAAPKGNYFSLSQGWESAWNTDTDTSGPRLVIDEFDDEPPRKVARISASDIIARHGITWGMGSTASIEPVHPPRVPPGGWGLLGGSGKMSKLAALAKARKEAQAASKAEKEAAPGLASVSLLSKLTAAKTTPKAAAAPHTPTELPAPQAPAEPAVSEPESSQPSSIPPPQSPVPPPVDADDVDMSEAPPLVSPTPFPSSPEHPTSEPALVEAIPSVFATSLFGSGDYEVKYRSKRRREADSRFFYLPATAAPEVVKAFSGPSPDDVVIAAREAGSKSGKKAKTAEKDQAIAAPTNQLEADMEAMNMGSSATGSAPVPAPPIKIAKKKVNVVDEYAKVDVKESANFVIIGHVDAGKSTMMGRLLYDIGAVDERTIQKFRKESEKMGKGSFALAWVMDSTDEERARGVTVDIATNQFETPKRKFTILDAPGHADFVPNMIAGAAQADFAVLVIDASTGGFESGFNARGQTKEHALLVRSLGVQNLIVAVNKLDSVYWNHERFEEIEMQVSQFLTNAGFDPQNVQYIPCSGLSGENLVKRSAEPALTWFNGPTVLGALESIAPAARAIEKSLRVSVQDVYKAGVTGGSVTISGRIDAGNVQVGETVLAAPSGEPATVKSMQVNDDIADWAVAGSNVVLNLNDIDPMHLKAGDILCDPQNPVPTVRAFRARIITFDLARPITNGATMVLHRGRINEAARIQALVATIDRADGQVIKKKPRHLTSGQSAIVEIAFLGNGIPMETFKDSKDLGRVILRTGGDTIAAGIVDELL